MKVTKAELQRMSDTASKIMFGGGMDGLPDSLLDKFDLFTDQALFALNSGDIDKAQRCFEVAVRAEQRIEKIFNEACERGYW